MEKEIYMAWEEATRRNVKIILDHSNETRRLTKKMEVKIIQLEEQIRIQNTTIEDLRKMLLNVQQKIYSGGS